MGLSYRRAWGKIKELEQNLGFALVQSAVGGAGGGHTSLTAPGIEFVNAYRRFNERMEAELVAAYAAELAGIVATARSNADEPDHSE